MLWGTAMIGERLLQTTPYLIIHLGIIAGYLTLLKFKPIVSQTIAQTFAFFSFLILLVFVGLRYEIGADWIGYRNLFYAYKVNVFNGTKDPFFIVLMFISSLFPHSISYQVLILLMAAFFLIPIYWYFCFTKKNPTAFIGFVSVSFPFLIPLFGLGYLRQGISSSFSLFIWGYFKKKNLLLCILFCIIATGFHKSGLIFFIFPGILIYEKTTLAYKRLLLISAGSAFSLILIFAAIYWAKSYINGLLNSKGVLFRVGYALALILALYKSKLQSVLKNNTALICLGLILFLCANLFISTIIDRIILFAIMILFAEMALSNVRTRTQLVFIGSAFLYLFGWLNFSTWATMGWIPYKSYLIEMLNF